MCPVAAIAWPLAIAEAWPTDKIASNWLFSFSIY